MKLKIKIKYFSPYCKPSINGDWIDLKARKGFDITSPRLINNGDSKLNIDIKRQMIPLGVAMQLPKGFEAQLLSRSSTDKNFKIIPSNCKGIIDQVYNGNNDEWQYPALMLGDSEVRTGDRICQFRIVLSQFATPWQKLKWFLSSGVKFKEVKVLKNKNRGGFGTTGRR